MRALLSLQALEMEGVIRPWQLAKIKHTWSDLFFIKRLSASEQESVGDLVWWASNGLDLGADRALVDSL